MIHLVPEAFGRYGFSDLGVRQGKILLWLLDWWQFRLIKSLRYADMLKALRLAHPLPH